MIGKTFNSWTVIRETSKEDRRGKGISYHCRCKCGIDNIVNGSFLRLGRSKQCINCQKKELNNPEREIGKRYNRLVVLKYIGLNEHKEQCYLTRCDCGKDFESSGTNLRLKKCTQCRECKYRFLNMTHGKRYAPIYSVWESMISRCYIPTATGYKNYGGRGISVCNAWHNFENFYKDMGDRPEGLEIDRINNEGNYEKSNCHWVTHWENNQNKRKYTRKKGLS